MRGKIVGLIAMVALVTVLGLAGCGSGNSKSGEPGSGIWNVTWSATTATLALTFAEDGNATGTLTYVNNGMSVPVTGHKTSGEDTILDWVAPDGTESRMTAVFDGDAATGTVKIHVPGHPESDLAAPFNLIGTRSSSVPSQSSGGASLAGSWQAAVTIDGVPGSEVDTMVLEADGRFTMSDLAGTYTVSGSQFSARSDPWTQQVMGSQTATGYTVLEGTLSGNNTIDGTVRIVITKGPAVGASGSFRATKI